MYKYKGENMENEKQNETIKLLDVLKSIMSSNVNLSNEDYEKMINEVAHNYDANNRGEGKTAPTLDERRERIKSNYYGTCVNMLFNIMTGLDNFRSQYEPLIEAIAEKVGVEFEKVETAEEKAQKAAAEYLRESARAKRAEAELAEKQNLNRQQRRSIEKKTGEVIKFKPKGE